MTEMCKLWMPDARLGIFRKSLANLEALIICGVLQCAPMRMVGLGLQLSCVIVVGGQESEETEFNECWIGEVDKRKVKG